MSSLRGLYNCTLIFATLLFISLGAQGNDSAGTTAGGGIHFIKSPEIQMLSEKLHISPKSVQVIYEFKNTSNKDVTKTIIFPLPPYKQFNANQPWDEELGATRTAAFVNFSVFANGLEVSFKKKESALMEGKDITSLLQKNQIPLNPILVSGQLPLPEKQSRNVEKWQKSAKELGLLDAANKPRWQKQVSYYWTQVFPAQKTITISHFYRPASGVFFDETHKSIEEDFRNIQERMETLFGVDSNNLENKEAFKNWLLKRREKIAKPNVVYAYFQNVNYILTTGANWSGPIKFFELTIHYPEDGVVAYNRFYHTFSSKSIKNTPGQLTIKLQDFVPSEELQTVFAMTQP